MKVNTKANEYFANLEVYPYMAHYVARKLSQIPSSILDEWSVPALLVAYGFYANEESSRNFNEWQSLSPEARRKSKRPEKFHVRFHSPEDLEKEGGD